MRLTQPVRALLVGAAVMLLVLAGCTSQVKGSDGPQKGDVMVSAGADGVQAVTIDATSNYRFVPATVRVKVGPVRITLSNKGGAGTHSLAFKPGGPTAEIPFLSPGDAKSIDFTVGTPGTYQFICTFHEALGQRGNLIVSA